MSSPVTNDQIRKYRRSYPETIDMLMVAIHSLNAELRRMARQWFAEKIKQASDDGGLR